MSRLARSTGFLIRLAQLRIYEAFHAALSEHGITPTRYSLLAVLHDNPWARPGQLAEALRVKPSNITALLAQFEAEGLCVRSTHPIERRATIIHLTEAGEALLARISGTVQALEAQSVAMLSAEECRQLHQALVRIAQPEK